MDGLSATAAPSLRDVVVQFLQERLAAKLEKIPEGDPRREALHQQFQPETWVEDAARRVSRIQVVTHSLKPIHPEAKGTNLYKPPRDLVPHELVGSHVLGDEFEHDVVGNAADLDVYKFLTLEYQGKPILERALSDDEELLSALSKDREQSRSWAEAFAGIVRPRGGDASDTWAKQVYWLVGTDPKDDKAYHLLAPLYATSLAHHVYQILQEDLFGEAVKEARKARREKRYSEHSYRDYPGLAVQKLGGTKPQNISQLNIERGGRNYLLSSCPPVWEDQGLKPPLHIDSVFLRFERRRQVKWLVQKLRAFLEKNPPSNASTRDRRDAFTDAIIDELVIFAAQLRTLPPGWSDTPECRLHVSEVLWLDAHRCEIDAEFAAARERGDWRDEVTARFGNWLNHALQKKLSLGDDEWSHWRGCLAGKLDALQEDLTYE